MDVRDRLDYAMQVREIENPHQLHRELKAYADKRVHQGKGRVPNVSPRDVYQFLSETRRKIPPLPTLEALAEVLAVRRVWLAFGEGPMEADVPADFRREVFLIGGPLAESESLPDPETRNEARRAFHARSAFGAAQGFEDVSLTVVVMFANYLARFFQRCREEGTGNPDDAGWRGREAASVFNRAVHMVQNRAPAEYRPEGPPANDPRWTGALLWALGSWEMQRPPED